MEVIWVKTISCLGRCWWQKSAKAVLAGILAAMCSRNNWEGNSCCSSNTKATIAIATAAAVLSIAAVVVGGRNGLGRWQQQ